MRRFFPWSGFSKLSVRSYASRYSEPRVSQHKLPRNSLHSLSPASPDTDDRINEHDTPVFSPKDLLTTYQHLVALGKIKSDDEQIRVVMQVRPRLAMVLVTYSNEID